MSSLDFSAAFSEPMRERFSSFQHTKLYDMLAASPIIAWFGFCEYHQVPHLLNQIGEIGATPITALLVISLASKVMSLMFVALLGAMLVLRHTPLAKCHGLYPRVAAIAGTYLGVSIVLQQPTPLPATLHLLSIVLILGGSVFSLYSLSHLGRSISMMPEARRLVTDGPYAFIRHPLYLGEAVALFGLTLQYFSSWSLIILSIQCAFQFERMKNEELVLGGTFPEYAGYMKQTPRLVPGLY